MGVYERRHGGVVIDGVAVLRSTDLPERLHWLGFAPDDAADAVRAARSVVDRPDLAQDLTRVVGVLRCRLGAFLDDRLGPRPPDPFGQCGESATPELGPGVLPMLALVATAHDVHAWHRSRGVDEEVSRATLSDLGRQVALHRQAFGDLGLEAFRTLLSHWQGSLHQLGRLQLDLQRVRTAGRRGAALAPELRSQDWVVNVRIPQQGPLRTQAVEDSLRRAGPFFARHLDGIRPTVARCTSWLLDPYLATVLPADSHVVRFQRRFTAFGARTDSNEDAVYFTFGRRGLHDLDRLPRDTVLRRAVLDRIAAGGHWQVVQGWTTLPSAGVAARQDLRPGP